LTYVAIAALASALAAVITISLLLHRAQREAMAVRDLLDSERTLARQYGSERDLEVAAHAVTREQLKQERDLRAVAEAQRNEALRSARDFFVAKIENAGIADAGRLVADLLASPLPGLPPALPRSEAPGTALIDPSADL
jgi:hypothetical protein